MKQDNIELLDEQRSEKTMASIEIVDIPSIPEHEYFVRMEDFEKLVLTIVFISFILTAGAILI